VDGLSGDRIAIMYKVHKSTASRWISSARDRLVEQTRSFLAKRLNLPRAEVESLMRILQSQLEVTLERLLNDAPKP
jgi:RNA polymerase sigma-70 factor, ECF subfamily